MITFFCSHQLFPTIILRNELRSCKSAKMYVSMAIFLIGFILLTSIMKANAAMNKNYTSETQLSRHSFDTFAVN